jgi:hypothetical protein
MTHWYWLQIGTTVIVYENGVERMRFLTHAEAAKFLRRMHRTA